MTGKHSLPHEWQSFSLSVSLVPLGPPNPILWYRSTVTKIFWQPKLIFLAPDYKEIKRCTRLGKTKNGLRGIIMGQKISLTHQILTSYLVTRGVVKDTHIHNWLLDIAFLFKYTISHHNVFCWWTWKERYERVTILVHTAKTVAGHCIMSEGDRVAVLGGLIDVRSPQGICLAQYSQYQLPGFTHYQFLR